MAKNPKLLIDMTGVGEYIVEDMQNTGINTQIEGIKFTQETKEQLANNLKQLMTEKQLKIPYDPELIAELNTERYQLTKEGKIRLTHPEGTNDDRFWSLALAAYAAKTTPPKPALWIVTK